jgi:transketolase
MVRDLEAFNAIARGGYVLSREQGELDLILIATGSEVGLAAQAAEQLQEDGLGVRLVSIPCTEVFLAQDADYQNTVLPAECSARVAVEAAHPDYWYRFVGLQGAVVGIDRFGVSAPGDEAMAAMGMTVKNVVSAARSVLGTAED